MFQKGDLVIYGSTGVCEVEDITQMKNLSGIKDGPVYYVLNPRFQAGKIYSPVENQKVFMRPVISKEIAEGLINAIPAVQTETLQNKSVQELSAYCQEAIHADDCQDLITLTMSIYAKKLQVEAQNKRFSQTDSRLMKRAEDLLHGELSAALDIPFEEIKLYIANRVAEA